MGKAFRELFLEISAKQKWDPQAQANVLLEVIEEVEEENRHLHDAAPRMACTCMQALADSLRVRGQP